MNPTTTRPGRSFLGRIGQFGARLIVARTARRMDGLPEHVKKDIGWPPYGDLDVRNRS